MSGVAGGTHGGAEGWPIGVGCDRVGVGDAGQGVADEGSVCQVGSDGPDLLVGEELGAGQVGRCRRVDGPGLVVNGLVEMQGGEGGGLLLGFVGAVLVPVFGGSDREQECSRGGQGKRKGRGAQFLVTVSAVERADRLPYQPYRGEGE